MIQSIARESRERLSNEVIQNPTSKKSKKRGRKKNRKKRSLVMTAGNLGRRGHAAAADEMAVTTRLLKRPSAAGTSAKPPKDQETNKEQLHGGTVKIHNPDALKLLYDLGLDDINTDEAPATDIT